MRRILIFIICLSAMWALIQVRMSLRTSSREIREKIALSKDRVENLNYQITKAESRLVVETLEADAPPSRRLVKEMQKIMAELLQYKRAHGSFPDPQNWREQLLQKKRQEVATSTAFSMTKSPEFMRNFALEGFRKSYDEIDYTLEKGVPKISMREDNMTIELNQDTLSKYHANLETAYGAYLHLPLSSGKVKTIATMNKVIKELGQYLAYCKVLPVDKAGERTFDLAYLEENCGK